MLDSYANGNAGNGEPTSSFQNLATALCAVC